MLHARKILCLNRQVCQGLVETAKKGRSSISLPRIISKLHQEFIT